MHRLCPFDYLTIVDEIICFELNILSVMVFIIIVYLDELLGLLGGLFDLFLLR